MYVHLHFCMQPACAAALAQRIGLLRRLYPDLPPAVLPLLAKFAGWTPSAEHEICGLCAPSRLSMPLSSRIDHHSHTSHKHEACPALACLQAAASGDVWGALLIT